MGVPLGQGNVITSKNNRLELNMTADGNLVLYCLSNRIWASNTNGNGANIATFQKDGNLVIRQNNVIIYAANSYDKKGAKLVVQDDANLVIYTNDGLKAIWASHTMGQCECKPCPCHTQFLGFDKKSRRWQARPLFSCSTSIRTISVNWVTVPSINV